jgi:hypothetical protein
MTTDTTRAQELALTVRSAKIGIEDQVDNATYLSRHLAAVKLYADPAFDLNEPGDFDHVLWAANQGMTRARWAVEYLDTFMGQIRELADAAEAGETW